MSYKEQTDARRMGLAWQVARITAALFPIFVIVLNAPGTASAGVMGLVSSVFSQVYASPVSSNDALALVHTTNNSQTIALLSAARHTDPNPSRGGGDIQVVDGSALVAEGGPIGFSSNTQGNPGGGISLYIVREGDTLTQIAEMFRVSVNTVAWANDISSKASLATGQTLIILPITGMQHTIKNGETLDSIAKTYSGDAGEILRYNGLADASSLVVGATITIPGGEEPPPPAPTSKKTSSSEKKSSVSRSRTVRVETGSVSSGYFTNPLPSGIKTQGLHGYNGIDIGAPAGTPIIAAASGSVIISRQGGWNGGYGNYVVLDHPNGTQTLYAHMTETSVSEGESVVQGQVIGYVGSTGKSTGNHLHFEVRGARNPF